MGLSLIRQSMKLLHILLASILAEQNLSSRNSIHLSPLRGMFLKIFALKIWISCSCTKFFLQAPQDSFLRAAWAELPVTLMMAESAEAFLQIHYQSFQCRNSAVEPYHLPPAHCCVHLCEVEDLLKTKLAFNLVDLPYEDMILTPNSCMYFP